MTEDKGYNGWTNYETWVTALWIDNEQGSYGESRRVLSEAITENEWNPSQSSWPLVDALRDWAEEWFIDNITENGSAGLHVDLLRAAWSEINWDEIARNYAEELTP